MLKAYQLTSKFKSFKELGKQSGFLFYIQAWNTSKIDPVTGFVNFFDTKYTNVESAQQFFNKFDSIKYNEKKNWFEFAFDYNKFTTKAEETKTKWIVCTNSTRIETFRNPEKNSQWDNREINLTEELKQLLAKYSIKLDGDLKANIVKQQEKGFFENLLKLFRLTVQMRNSITNSEIDYLISPVPNEDGIFYDSRNADKNLPENADANGAYNIARKGLWVLNQIKNSKPDDKKLNLAITNKEWLKYAQKKPYRK